MEECICKISREEIQSVLEGIKERDVTEKGEQPELALGCFYSSGRTDNEECLKCRFYEPTCRQHLKGFEVNPPLMRA